jgi:hypothetical protein
MTIDTAHVADRRALSFHTLAEAVSDAERIAASDREGTLRRAGNWTASQVMNHVAAFMEYPYDGYPPELSSPPWFVKFVLKMMKAKYLRGPLPKGVRIPKVPGGTVGVVDGPTDAAQARFRRAAERMQQSPPPMPNPVFGPLTHEEWMQLHCRHAELHFGFLHP